MREFNSIVAHFGNAAIPGRIEALEGGRGFMRVALDPGEDALPVQEGSECILEMHDGARFRFAVVERLDGHTHAFRMKLLGRASPTLGDPAAS
ncbi:hypothetical protein [Deinococcus aluminii]|uniref:Uncharacterized protein n=1 Tax=Deinococcus aluminii TaxID=1656885 RepID=A0ABP9XCB3_9DEIO